MGGGWIWTTEIIGVWWYTILLFAAFFAFYRTHTTIPLRSKKHKHALRSYVIHLLFVLLLLLRLCWLGLLMRKKGEGEDIKKFCHPLVVVLELFSEWCFMCVLSLVILEWAAEVGQKLLRPLVLRTCAVFNIVMFLWVTTISIITLSLSLSLCSSNIYHVALIALFVGTTLIFIAFFAYGFQRIMLRKQNVPTSAHYHYYYKEAILYTFCFCLFVSLRALMLLLSVLPSISLSFPLFCFFLVYFPDLGCVCLQLYVFAMRSADTIDDYLMMRQLSEAWRPSNDSYETLQTHKMEEGDEGMGDEDEYFFASSSDFLLTLQRREKDPLLQKLPIRTRNFSSPSERCPDFTPSAAFHSDITMYRDVNEEL